MSLVLQSWSHAIAGGVMIGLASGGLMMLHGRIAGISGIFNNAIEPGAGSRESWRWAFLGGMLATGLVARMTGLLPPLDQAGTGLITAIGAGLIIGAGTRMGSGCTSGHGVCGLARLSMRSLVAVLTFVATGMIVTALLRVMGVSP